jgi:hypothetical protein
MIRMTSWEKMNNKERKLSLEESLIFEPLRPCVGVGQSKKATKVSTGQWFGIPFGWYGAYSNPSGPSGHPILSPPLEAQQNSMVVPFS